MRCKKPVLHQQRCVSLPETGIFKRFLTLFDGLFTDPGRPGVAGTAGAQRRSTTDSDL